MAHTGINLENVKENNRSAILKLLNEQGAMSRKDLAEQLGLTAATVTLICSDLIGMGILREQGAVNEGRRAGRKKILVGIDYTCRYVLSVCIEANDTWVALSDLKGEKVAEKQIKTDNKTLPTLFLSHVAAVCQEVVQQSGIPTDQVLGVGVSVPGAVDRQLGVSKSAYRVWEHRVEVSKILEKHLGWPVILENNVKAFAEAELIYGSGKKNNNLLFLKWGPGIGSALVVHDEIYESHTSKEGEIGHITVEKGGKLCRCGRRGCLETKASIHSIAEQVSSTCTLETMPTLYRHVKGDISQIRARNMEDWIQVTDAGMWKVLDGIIEQVAWNVCHALTLLAPEALILYGQVFTVPQVRERFLKFCREYDPAYDEDYIILSELNERIDYIGPLAIVVNQLFFATGGGVLEQSK